MLTGWRSRKTTVYLTNSSCKSPLGLFPQPAYLTDLPLISLESRKTVRSAGHFSIHPPSPLARELLVITGKLLCFIEDDKKDIRMIVLKQGHRL